MTNAEKLTLQEKYEKAKEIIDRIVSNDLRFCFDMGRRAEMLKGTTAADDIEKTQRLYENQALNGSEASMILAEFIREGIIDKGASE